MPAPTTLVAELAALREFRDYLNADGMRRLALLTVVESYERAARDFRPDWDGFVIEAAAEPAEIAWEMVDHADHAEGIEAVAPYLMDGGDIDQHFIDELFATAQTWVHQVADDPMLPPGPPTLAGQIAADWATAYRQWEDGNGCSPSATDLARMAIDRGVHTDDPEVLADTIYRLLEGGGDLRAIAAAITEVQS